MPLVGISGASTTGAGKGQGLSPFHRWLDPSNSVGSAGFKQAIHGPEEVFGLALCHKKTSSCRTSACRDQRPVIFSPLLPLSLQPNPVPSDQPVVVLTDTR